MSYEQHIPFLTKSLYSVFWLYKLYGCIYKWNLPWLSAHKSFFFNSNFFLEHELWRCTSLEVCIDFFSCAISLWLQFVFFFLKIYHMYLNKKHLDFTYMYWILVCKISLNVHSVTLFWSNMEASLTLILLK